MGWFQIQDPEDIAGIIAEAISKKADLSVHIRRLGLPCSSRLLAILPAFAPQGPSTPSNGRLGLLIEGLTPKQGDDLIQDFPEVDVRFAIHEYGGRFRTKFRAINGHSPPHGLTLDFPANMALQAQNGADRVDDDALKPFSAILRVTGRSRRAQVYELPVISWSGCSLGLLVTDRDAGLLTPLERGEPIPEITLFAESGLLVLEGVVRHMWHVESRFHQESHILDLEIRAAEDGFARASAFSASATRKMPEQGLFVA